jgi:hypothetical protein
VSNKLNVVVSSIAYTISYLKGYEERLSVLFVSCTEGKIFASVDGKPKSYNLKNLEIVEGSIVKGDKLIVDVSKAEYYIQKTLDNNNDPIYNILSGYTVRKDDQYEKPVVKKGMASVLKTEMKNAKTAKKPENKDYYSGDKVVIKLVPISNLDK